MGIVDRGIRIVVALAVVVLIASSLVTGVLAIILGIVGAIFLLTSVISFCPLYTLFGLSTCPTKISKN